MAVITQNNALDIQSGSVPVTVHLSQGDVGNTVGFYLYNGSDVLDLDGCQISVHGIRQDCVGFGPYQATIRDNYASFNVQSVMTAIPGACLAELTITDGSGTSVGTANFAMLVEKGTFPNGPVYDTDISVYQQILNYVQTIPADIRDDYVKRIQAETARAEASEDELRQGLDEADVARKTISDLLQSEITTRQSEDKTLQKAISDEAAARTEQDASLQSQINQIIAPSGEAPSAAEVQNARIGADGTVYTTLGDAIRTQYSDLYDDLISELYSNSLDVIGLLTKPTTTVNGVTFTYNKASNEYTVSGTASNTAFVNLFNNGSAYPFGLSAGKTYRAVVYTDNVSFRLFAYPGGSATEILNTRYSTTFTIPANSTGISIRLNVASGTSVSETFEVPKIVEVPTNEDIVNAIDRLTALTVRDIIPELPLNKNNISDTTAGVTFRWNENKTKITISGTASTVAYYNIYANPSVLPDGIEPGKTYQIEFSGVGVDFGVLAWTSTTNFTTLVVTKTDAAFTVPANATGVTLRLGVASGTTINEVIQVPKVLNAYTNKKLTAVVGMQTLASGSDANTVEDGLYLCLSGYAYENLPEEVGFLESHTNANIKLQRFVAFAARDTYTRRSLNGTFESWYHVTGIDDRINLAMFGDSVTWGRDGAGTGRVAETMPMIIGRYSRHIATTNFGVGSMGWLTKAGSPSMNALEKVQATDLTGFDAVSYCYGLNDPDSPMGTYLDTGTDTIMGVIYNIFQYVNNTYPGMVQILIGIPNSCLHTEIGFPQWDWYRVRAGGWSDETLDAEMKKFADYYHISYISNKQNVLNAWNITHYLPDGIHPNQAGYKLFGSRLRSQLEAILGA